MSLDVLLLVNTGSEFNQSEQTLCVTEFNLAQPDIGKAWVMLHFVLWLAKKSLCVKLGKSYLTKTNQKRSEPE